MIKLNEFFNRYLENTNQSKKTTYVDSYNFGNTEKMSAELLNLVLKGQKRATATSIEVYRLGIQKMPKVGDLNIVTDFFGNPKCVVKNTGVTILPFKDFTYDIVRREGEDDSLESWREGHIRYFKSESKELGYVFSEDMLVVFEDFQVVYQE